MSSMQRSESLQSPFVPFSPNPSHQQGTPTTTAPLSATLKHSSMPPSSLRYASNRKSIYDRNLNRSQKSELSKASFAFLFGEMVQLAQKKVSGIQDLEKKLNLHGYTIGQRLLELLLWRDGGRSAKRETRILGILQFITTRVWLALFNKPADALEKSRDKEDEYMLIDNDPMVNSYISVPKEMAQLNCAAFVAGIIEAVLDGCLFQCKVTAHTLPTEQWPGNTVFLIKFDESVLERESVL
ncbi:Trafficking protein particle complex subunit 31 [Rhizina undulata]